MTVMRSSFIARLLSLGALLGSAPTASTATYAVLPDHHPDAGDALAVVSDATPSRRIRMQAHLKPRNEAELDRLLDAQQDPSSPRYRRWLSAAEYERRFGPTQADVDEVARWLSDQGFTVTLASTSQARVAFEGTVAQTGRAFRVRMAAGRGGTYFNVGDPMVPAAFAAKIDHVGGLHNLDTSHMNVSIPEPYNNQLSAPHFGPPDVWVQYDAKPLLDMGMDGAGQCVAVLNGSDVDQESLTLFNGFMGLPAFAPGGNYDVVYPDGPPGIAPPIGSSGAEAYSEALLDVQWAHGIAPGAQIVLYAGNYPALGTDGLVNTVIAATTDNRCAAISISWAQCGLPKSFFKMLDKHFKRGAAQGQSIFVATGDVGVNGCNVPNKRTIQENAGSPNVTAVGATMIRGAQYDDGGIATGVSASPEEVWFFSIPVLGAKTASTGGVSKFFKRPKFQKRVPGIKGKKRVVPDISLGGGLPFPGYWTCLDFGLYGGGPAEGSTCTTSGGTSVVAPQYGGIVAIIASKIGRVGNINTTLYAMAKANAANLAAVGIRDVTVGNNGYDPLPGYDAVPGFDLASGWGSIDIATFVNAFIAASAP